MRYAALVALLLLAGSSLSLAQWKDDGMLAAPPRGGVPGMYHGSAVKTIKQALAKAAKSNRRVLLVFGGEWCYDCHVLEHNFRTDRALQSLLQANYYVVHVDVGKYDKNLDLAAKYKMNLSKGVPAVAVLGSDGKLLYSDPGGFFENARTMTKQSIADFLNQWAPKKK
jgi:thioredoxin 1